jgi:hypothetical protein
MKRSQHRFSPRAACVALLFACLLPVVCMAALGPLPGGLVAVIENKPGKDQSTDLNRVMNNPSISGVALQIHWADIEPAKGQFDWAKLDQLFAAADGSKKWVQLLIFPGFFTPAWALDGVETEQFPLQYGPGHGDVETLPMPWDRLYLARWLEFTKRLAARYGANPAFRVMAADGPTSVSAEYSLPSNPDDVQKWLAHSYTPARYLAAWRVVISAISADFPNQYISLSLGSGLNINEKGRLDAASRKRVKQAMIDQAMELLKHRFVLQYSNLDGNPGPDRGPPGTDLIISYNGRAITGFQLRTNCENNSANMGADGNPPLALRRAIDKGMAPNQAGQHVNYVEIYLPDALADDTQPVLSYGAGLFGR